MKKITAILLFLMLAAGVTACAAREEPAAPAAQLSVDLEAINASESNAQTDDVPPASDTDAAPQMDEAAYEAAVECKGQSVEVLFAAIGEPTGGAEYATSCEEEDAEDGMLKYDGFYVWTVKTESEETVHDVYRME